NRKLFLEANPIPVKWALQRMGMIGEGIRLPLTPFSEKFHAELEEAMKASGVL
ncbi:MAG: 4-hydroxy-tetrahydrodipicolinate synthase, partial [Pseudomonadales bacterium]